MNNVRWFLHGMKESFKRVSKKDPIAFWCAIGGAITGTISLILHFIR